jgi:hypothetical protein
MKIIFLDIDGVLNCKGTPNPRKFPYIVDPKLLNRLQRLLERTGAEVVLRRSSLTICSGGRRPKSAKARNRGGGWCGSQRMDVLKETLDCAAANVPIALS